MSARRTTRPDNINDPDAVTELTPEQAFTEMFSAGHPGLPAPDADAADPDQIRATDLAADAYPDQVPDAGAQEFGTDEGDATDDPDQNSEQDLEAGSDTPAAGGKAARDAARYRTQLRDEQAAHQQTRDQLTAMQRQHAELVASAALEHPAALWINGFDPAALVNDQGTIDTEKLTERINALVNDYGVSTARRAPIGQQPRVALRPAGSPDLLTPSFADAFARPGRY